MSKIELKHTGESDDWSRPIYQDNKGVNYVDVNIDDKNPDPHHLTNWGEPLYSVEEFTIVSEFSTAISLRASDTTPERLFHDESERAEVLIMKTNLNITIKTEEDAKRFLAELEGNNESFHPEDDANSIEWDLPEKPTSAECDQLNILMSACNSIEGFDPCEFLMELSLEYTINISGFGSKYHILKSLKEAIKMVEDETVGESDDNTLSVDFKEMWS